MFYFNFEENTRPLRWVFKTSPLLIGLNMMPRRIDLQHRFSIFPACFRIFCFTDVNQWFESCTHTNFERSSSKSVRIKKNRSIDVDMSTLCCGLIWSVDPHFSHYVHNNERHFLNLVYPTTSSCEHSYRLIFLQLHKRFFLGCPSECWKISKESSQK